MTQAKKDATGYVALITFDILNLDFLSNLQMADITLLDAAFQAIHGENLLI